MTIRKKKDHWYTEFMYAGKRISRACEGCTTRRQAEAYEKQLREKMIGVKTQKSIDALYEERMREKSGGKGIPLADAFDAYLRKPARRHAAADKEKSNRRHWEDFVAFMAAKHSDVTYLDQVTSAHASEYIDYLRIDGRFVAEVHSKRTKHVDSYTPKRTRLSVTTINDYHTVCKAVFQRMANDAGIIRNPFKFDTMKAMPENREIFSPQELQLINDNLGKNPFCRPLFVIGINTGLTLGDVCTLKWEQISNGFIVRRRNKTGARLEIPILPAVSNLLSELSEEQKHQPKDEFSDYVLPEHARMYCSTNRSGVSYRIKQFLKGLGIVTIRETDGARKVSVKDIHSLRHTFAYIAGICKIPLTIVQSILGHMTPEMTKHYQEHATREDAANALRQLPSLLGDSVTGQALPHGIERDDAEDNALRQRAIQLMQQLPIGDVEDFLRQHGG